MATTIQPCFDKASAWSKVKDKITIFLDTNGWIEMRDDKCPIAGRVRERLKNLVSEGRVICPLSWGLIEELFKQSHDSRKRTARLMEELTLNVAYYLGN